MSRGPDGPIGGAISFTPFRFYGASYFIYAAAMIPFIDRDRPRLTYLAIYLGLVAGFGVASGQQFWFFVPAVFIAGVIGLNIHWAQVFMSNARLRLAHSEVEHLAKIAERERIARDLHDVLGHTLSVIALKSELASKLMERDPARAAQEIREVNEVARDALAQVRSAVTGYRASGLSAEFEAMRKALRTAGVALSLETDPAHPPRPRKRPDHGPARSHHERPAPRASENLQGPTGPVEQRGPCSEIEDDGPWAARATGLIGMRERVGLGGSPGARRTLRACGSRSPCP